MNHEPHDPLHRITDALLRDLIHIQQETLHEVRNIRKLLEPTFTLYINQINFHYGSSCDFYGNPINIRYGIYSTGESEMAAITAGSSATFFLSAVASDNSTPVLSSQQLTADDASVSIAQDMLDPSGNSFTVTVPASDTNTTFNLNATADVTSNTATTPQSVSATLQVTISAASQPVTFTLTINEK